MGNRRWPDGASLNAWIVAAVTFTTLLVGAGIRSSPGLLVVPLENEFHWSLATISFAISITNPSLFWATKLLGNPYGIRVSCIVVEFQNTARLVTCCFMA